MARIGYEAQLDQANTATTKMQAAFINIAQSFDQVCSFPCLCFSIRLCCCVSHITLLAKCSFCNLFGPFGCVQVFKSLNKFNRG